MTTPGPSSQADQWVALARCRRPQGRKGEVYADILTDFPRRFADRSHLWLLPENPTGPALPRPVELCNHWLHKGGIVLHFAGVDSISAAEALAGFLVAVPRSQRATLDPGEFYIGDLIGCQIADTAASPVVVVGQIQDVDLDSGPVPLLIVSGSSGEVLIPFAKSYLRSVDTAARRVEMALPEGLVDLNT